MLRRCRSNFNVKWSNQCPRKTFSFARHCDWRFPTDRQTFNEIVRHFDNWQRMASNEIFPLFIMHHLQIWDTQPFDKDLLLQQKINGTSVHLWASIFCFIRHHLKWVERSYNSLISVVKLPTLVNGMFLCRWMTFDYTRFAASPLVWVQDWFNKNNIPPCMCWEFHYKHDTILVKCLPQ